MFAKRAYVRCSKTANEHIDIRQPYRNEVYYPVSQKDTNSTQKTNSLEKFK